jgi:hypothetical protein
MNRSYLQIPKRDSAAGVRGMNGHASFCKMVISDRDDDMIFGGMNGDAETTGIINTLQRVGEQDVYYNLQGQRVDRPRKGIYIHNGRRVVIRSTTK